MKCNTDHSTLQTPYCPQCGALVKKPHPLDSLHEHVIARMAALAKQREEYVEYWNKLDREPTPEEAIVKGENLARIDNIRDKWLAWDNALDAVLQPVAPDEAEKEATDG